MAPRPARKGAPTSRAVAKGAPKRPSAVAADQPRLSLSSGAPGTVTGRGATAADREKAQQEQAAAIEAETQVLRQRIVELSALVERMQREIRAQVTAEQATAEAAKATPQESATTASSEPAKATSEPVKAASDPATAALEPAKATPGEAQRRSPPAPTSRLVGRQCGADRRHRFPAAVDRGRPSVEASTTRGGRGPMAPRPVAGVPHGPGAASPRLGIAQPDCRTRDRNVGIGVDGHRKGI